jgi:hypothetical protein
LLTEHVGVIAVSLDRMTSFIDELMEQERAKLRLRGIPSQNFAGLSFEIVVFFFG